MLLARRKVNTAFHPLTFGFRGLGLRICPSFPQQLGSWGLCPDRLRGSVGIPPEHILFSLICACVCVCVCYHCLLSPQGETSRLVSKTQLPNNQLERIPLTAGILQPGHGTLQRLPPFRLTSRRTPRPNNRCHWIPVQKLIKILAVSAKTLFWSFQQGKWRRREQEITPQLRAEPRCSPAWGESTVRGLSVTCGGRALAQGRTGAGCKRGTSKEVKGCSDLSPLKHSLGPPVESLE